ncbi:MAG: Serine/threonine phosphatase PPP [uncultured Solirubrobacteraceae bacterium]|uniref:Serine/threonine phosphatase PPP n=1 Tax=uncultured Solirubrobacteraceae bacterium TaxID=1162706 RepID=A0A6J4U696_9ACTN|nr:MAG: Serine/threonine phosphatase PPP [uncultured Solirubrobacteraceae bacterium]
MLRVAEHFSDSDPGRRREGNEDSMFVRSPLFVLADGMGGAQAGEVASRMAVEGFDPGLPNGNPAEALAQIIADANRRIHDSSVTDDRLAGMGTTITAAYVGEEDVTIAHVGDSRAYLLRKGELTRLTRDHSLVGELVARGKLTEEQAEHHPQRSVITRALGPEPAVEIDTDVYPAREGDVFLLCSDGLTDMIPEAALGPILGRSGTLADAGRRLISAANEAGGRDNITVVLFRLEAVHRAGDERAPASEQPTEVGEGALSTEDVAAAVREAEAAEAAERGGPRGAVALDEPPGDDPLTEAHPVIARPQPRAASSTPTAPPHPPAAEPSRGRRRRRIPPAAIFAFLIALPVVSGMLLALRAVYFIGTDPADGRTITVYRGLPYDLPAGIRLYTRYGGSGVTIDAIPPARREAFLDHKLRTRDDATELVDELELGRLQP